MPFHAFVASALLLTATSAFADINEGVPPIQSYAKSYRGAGVLRVDKWGIDPVKEVLKKDADCPLLLRHVTTTPYKDKRNYVIEVESPIHSQRFQLMFGGWGWASDMYLPDLQGPRPRRYINFASGADGWGATQLKLFFDEKDRVIGMSLTGTTSSLPTGYIPVPGGSLPVGPQEITDVKLTCNLY